MRASAGIALGLSAAAGLSYEVAITNILFHHFVESSYSIATVISVFLLGLGIGSYAVYALRKRIGHPAATIAVAQFALAGYAAIVLSYTEAIIASISTTGIIWTSILVLLPPTMLLGATFALAGRIIDDAGLLYAIDLGGAVLGAIAAGFLLIPILGNTTTIIVAACLNLLAGMLVIAKRRTLAIGATIAIAAIVFAVAVRWHANQEKVAVRTPFPFGKTEEISFFNNTQNVSRPSPYGTVELRGNRLYIDGHDECSRDSEQGEEGIVKMTLSQFSTKGIHAANIGLGCGMTAAAIVSEVDTTVDIIEINPVVAELNAALTDLLEHERANLTIDDGYQFFRHTNSTYDAIIIDIENPAVIHASNLYTNESFGAMKSRLSTGGVLAIWSYPCPSERYTAILASTLGQQFTHVYHPRQDIFLASDRQLPFSEIRSNSTVNTLDRKVLSKAYFDDCGFWLSPQTSTQLMFSK